MKRIIGPAQRGAAQKVAQRLAAVHAAAQQLEQAGMATAEEPLQRVDIDGRVDQRVRRKVGDEPDVYSPKDSSAREITSSFREKCGAARFGRDDTESVTCIES